MLVVYQSSIDERYKIIQRVTTQRRYKFLPLCSLAVFKMQISIKCTVDFSVYSNCYLHRYKQLFKL